MLRQANIKNLALNIYILWRRQFIATPSPSSPLVASLLGEARGLYQLLTRET